MNQRSGTCGPDLMDWLKDYCAAMEARYETVIRVFPEQFDMSRFRAELAAMKPGRVIVIGGDGTVRAVAECLLYSGIPLAIIPAGSANGLARELGIPADRERAAALALSGQLKQVHVVIVNGAMCLHLCDIGFNAFVVREFEKQQRRGMWSYVKAAWHVLWRHPVMQVTISTDEKIIRREAAMVVIANARAYGTGVVINPEGNMEDELFEIVIVRKISFSEIFKMKVTHRPYDPQKTEVYATKNLHIRSRRRVHFQIDGEYIGKVNRINAEIRPGALHIITADQL